MVCNLVNDNKKMKMTYKLITSLCVGIITATAVYFAVKSRKQTKRKMVADEGYETAYDSLFPLKKYKKYKTA